MQNGSARPKTARRKTAPLGRRTVVRGAIRSLKDAVVKNLVLFNLLNKMHGIFAY
jgi:hypothetical protein